MKAVAGAAPILSPGRTCWTVSPVTTSGLLIDGRDYFRAFHDAALAARRYLLLCGWQFDAGVSLLRGRDCRPGDGDTRLLPFLSRLCRRRPELRIFILCWDYSPAYLLQRPLLQDLVFNWTSPPGLRFRFDDRHAVGASHHQKFVVVDGALAFAGSMDLCYERWDTRDHACLCPDRQEAAGEDRHGPYHEVQAFLTGPAVADLQELFEARWKSSGGDELRLPPPSPSLEVEIRPSVRIAAREVGFSRTVARTLTPDQPSIREIRRLYVDAILAAEESIYLENQYFGARAVDRALLQRLSAPGRPRLNVVLVYPRELHSLTEEISMGKTQSLMFRRLRETAARHGHALGIYYSVSVGGPQPRPRYIHSKLIAVDDRFLTVGSANTNNRSMGLDTELNVSWECPPEGDPALAKSIRRARVSLLAEHAGVRGLAGIRRLLPPATLVEVLDEFARDPHSSLRFHPMASRVASNAVLSALEEGVSFDPETPLEEEELFERIAPSRKEILVQGFRRLRRAFVRRRRGRLVIDPPSAVARPPHALWSALVRGVRRLGPLLLAALLLWSLLSLLRRWLF